MDVTGFSVNRAAIRLTVASIAFILVQMGFVDPVIVNQYREQIVDIVSAVMVVIFGVELVITNAIKIYHKLKHDPEYVEKPGVILTLVNKVLGKYIVSTSNFRLFKGKTAEATAESAPAEMPQPENPPIAG